MSRDACSAARTALVAGESADAHLGACAACRTFVARLGRVDGALAAAAAAAASSPLPSALRARIVAAAAPAPPRARLLDFVLRAAAVAAVLLAGAWMAPADVLAAESDEGPLRIPDWGVGAPFVARLVETPPPPPAEPLEIPGGSAPLAGAAAILLAGALTLTVARRRP